MAFNGSGTFLRLYNWVNDKAANIKVRADRMDAEMDGMATGLSTCITKDGQTTVTANLPMANFRHTGVGNASARNDYAAAGQVQDGKLNWVAAGGTADAITASYNPAITTLVDGQICFVRAAFANTTTTPTFSPNAITPRTMTKNGNQALVAGDVYGAGHELILRYRLSDTKWELLNPAYPFVPSSAPFADTTAIVKGSSDATKLLRFEVDGFTTGTTRVATPPNEDFTMVGLATTQTLTNKSLQDSTTTFVDESDATKKLAFQCSSISTGTTRTVTIPDKSGTMAMTSDITAAMSVIYDSAVSASTGVDFTTATLIGGVSLGSYKHIRITLDLSVSTTAGIYMRTSNNNGSSFYATSGDYRWGHFGTAGAESNLSDAFMQLGNNTLSTVRKSTILITNLADANIPTFVEYRTSHETTFFQYQGLGSRTAAVAENAVRIYPSAGTMTGRLKIEAL